MGARNDGNAASVCAIDRFDCLAKSFAKADRDEQIFFRQEIDLVLKISRAASRSLCCESERRQTIRKKPRQRRRQIDTHHEDIACTMDPLRKIHRTIRR